MGRADLSIKFSLGTCVVLLQTSRRNEGMGTGDGPHSSCLAQLLQFYFDMSIIR
jgi:hypothetical protein